MAAIAIAGDVALDVGVRRGMQLRPTAVGAHAARWQVGAALLAVLLDPRLAWCPHPLSLPVAVAPAPSVPHAATIAPDARRWVRVLLLSARRALCLDCLALAGRALAEGAPVAVVDLPELAGRCDLCERRSQTFQDHVIALGPLVLCGAFCQRCSRMLARALGEGEGGRR